MKLFGSICCVLVVLLTLAQLSSCSPFSLSNPIKQPLSRTESDRDVASFGDYQTDIDYLTFLEGIRSDIEKSKNKNASKLIATIKDLEDILGGKRKSNEGTYERGLETFKLILDQYKKKFVHMKGNIKINRESLNSDLGPSMYRYNETIGGQKESNRENLKSDLSESDRKILQSQEKQPNNNQERPKIDQDIIDKIVVMYRRNFGNNKESLKSQTESLAGEMDNSKALIRDQKESNPVSLGSALLSSIEIDKGILKDQKKDSNNKQLSSSSVLEAIEQLLELYITISGNTQESLKSQTDSFVSKIEHSKEIIEDQIENIRGSLQSDLLSSIESNQEIIEDLKKYSNDKQGSYESDMDAIEQILGIYDTSSENKKESVKSQTESVINEMETMKESLKDDLLYSTESNKGNMKGQIKHFNDKQESFESDPDAVELILGIPRASSGNKKESLKYETESLASELDNKERFKGQNEGNPENLEGDLLSSFESNKEILEDQIKYSNNMQGSSKNDVDAIEQILKINKASSENNKGSLKNQAENLVRKIDFSEKEKIFRGQEESNRGSLRNDLFSSIEVDEEIIKGQRKDSYNKQGSSSSDLDAIEQILGIYETISETKKGSFQNQMESLISEEENLKRIPGNKKESNRESIGSYSGSQDSLEGIRGSSGSFSSELGPMIHNFKRFSAQQMNSNNNQESFGNDLGYFGGIRESSGSLRGSTGSLRGNTGSLRGSSGSLRGSTGSLRGNTGSLRGSSSITRGNTKIKRRGSEDRRRGSEDRRRGSEDRRRGSEDRRRGDGDRRRGSSDNRRESGERRRYSGERRKGSGGRRRGNGYRRRGSSEERRKESEESVSGNKKGSSLGLIESFKTHLQKITNPLLFIF